MDIEGERGIRKGGENNLGAPGSFFLSGSSNLRSNESRTPSPRRKLRVSSISCEWDSGFGMDVWGGVGGGRAMGGGVRGTCLAGCGCLAGIAGCDFACGSGAGTSGRWVRLACRWIIGVEEFLLIGGWTLPTGFGVIP